MSDTQSQSSASIVERLRDMAKRPTDRYGYRMLFAEAADEVERLRARIADLEDQLLKAPGERRALEGK